MEIRHRDMYLEEIRTQAKFAEIAIVHINLISLLHEKDLEELFFYISALLNAAGNVSKLITNTSGKSDDQRFRIERTNELRSILNLKDDSPILSRLVRNSFEHIDDRIDTWCVSEDNRGIVVRQVFGPQSAVTISKEHRTNKMRQYDPTTLEVGFFDDYINLQELANEMSRINEMAGEILS